MSELAALKGRSFPSAKVGCWIVDRVSGTIDGRSRLVSADLKSEAWVWTRTLVTAFEELDRELRVDSPAVGEGVSHRQSE